MSLTIVILAAGVGKRMKSSLPKPLHPIGGKPMLAHVLESARHLKPSRLIVVYGHLGQTLMDAFKDQTDITWIEQKTFEGTGDAMRYALPHCLPNSNILVLYGDTPLIDATTLQTMIDKTNEKTLSWLTVNLPDPTGYGRILRDAQNQMVGIIEHKDASSSEHSINEINSGLFVAPFNFLKTALPQLTNTNQQKEYYLTDIVSIAIKEGLSIATISGHPDKIRGVNDRIQLAELEALYQDTLIKKLMQEGTTVIDPKRVTLRGNVTAGIDNLIDINVILEGNVTLGNNVQIGAGCVIKNTTIGDNTTILPYSVIEGATIGAHVAIGPFARIREKTILKDHAKIGNFVETKNTLIEEGSKANHLTYLGDTTIGKAANIGAGTITCNYDGANKFKTIIKDRAFIGSNSALVAPVTIGENATVAAGSVITKDIADQALALTRPPLRQIPNWERPKKQ